MAIIICDNFMSRSGQLNIFGHLNARQDFSRRSRQMQSPEQKAKLDIQQDSNNKAINLRI